MSVGLDGMEMLARSITAVAADEPEGPIGAVAWMARNLIEREGLQVELVCRQVESLGAAAASSEHRIDFANAGHCRVFAVLCRVWAGELRDPTRGATIAHRHDEHPDWAERAVATALIGPWIFYRPNAWKPQEVAVPASRVGLLPTAEEPFVLTTSQWRL